MKRRSRCKESTPRVAFAGNRAAREGPRACCHEYWVGHRQNEAEPPTERHRNASPSDGLPTG